MFGLCNSGALLALAGIDFGSHTIKAVTLIGGPGKPRLGSVAAIPMPKGALIDYQLQDIERVSQALKALRHLIAGSSRYVATAVSGAQVITKVIQLDNRLNDSALESLVQLEAEQFIPFPLDEVSLDFEVIAHQQGQWAVLLSAARTESVNGRVTALAEAGMTTKVVDVATHALGRAVLACLPTLPGDGQVAVIDLGASTMTFAALVKGQITYSRLQNIGGEHYRQALAACYPLAEAGLAQIGGTLPALQPHIDGLITQVKRNIQLFCRSADQPALSTLVLTGGGSLLPGLINQFASECRCEVLHPDPFALLGRPAGSGGLCHGAKYMTALGLALRSFTPCQR